MAFAWAVFVGPGCFVCPWAAARPRAVRAAGPASVGLAAVCAGGRRPAREIATREPSARSGRSRGPPWPRRHPRAPQPGPPIPPAPSTPVTPVADMRLGASSRSPARPRHRPRTPQPGPSESFRPCARSHLHPQAPQPGPLTPLIPAPTTNFACNSLATLSNLEF